MDPLELVRYFVSEGPKWVREQRAEHRPAGRSLFEHEKLALHPFFQEHILEKARITNVPVIPNPEFYAPLQAQGIPMPLDFSQTSGITFDDTILLSELHPVPPSEHLPLLFHELVHVVQFELAGIDDFVERYVMGWAQNGFAYESIPLEAQAYALDARFASQPHLAFSVNAEAAVLMRQIS
jgi:hypothetical protein